MIPEIYVIDRIMLPYITIIHLRTIMYQLRQKPTSFQDVIVLVAAEI